MTFYFGTESKIYVIPVGELARKDERLRSKDEFRKYKLNNSKGTIRLDISYFIL